MTLLRFVALTLAELGVLVVLAAAGGVLGVALAARRERRAARDRVCCARRPRQVVGGWTQPQVDREVRDIFEREGLR